jgi:pantoate--beta-alanine ligase
MQILSTVTAMQRLAKKWRRDGTKVGLVPTMGYLHDGHMSLVRAARRLVGPSGRVVLSIYVNPTQFGPNEDLSKYPRDLQRDLAMCRAEGVDTVFVPGDREMYADLNASASRPEAFSTYVVEEKLSRSMEGASRPLHFRGVTTVVAKLFNLVLPEIAVFGQKDFQQAAIIQRMVRDLDFPVRIIVAPTRREANGLAMSSRNKYLDPEQRAQATILFHALQAVALAVRRRPQSAKVLQKDLRKFIQAAPLAKLDYVAFFDPETLEPVARVKSGAHMALAVYFGKTRLIDNARL